MSKDEDSDYALWVQLANDPSQSEEARQQYRAQMEAYIHAKLREAFQFAANQTPPGSQPAKS
jgi:flagellar biosynthesis protein FliP